MLAKEYVFDVPPLSQAAYGRDNSNPKVKLGFFKYTHRFALPQVGLGVVTSPAVRTLADML